MTADQFIDEALHLGAKEGIAALAPLQKVVFSISEAEVSCAIDGIESLIDCYGLDSMHSFSAAFNVIGAVDVATAFNAIAQSPRPIPDNLLSIANSLVNERHGYGYEDIRAYIATRV